MGVNLPGTKKHLLQVLSASLSFVVFGSHVFETPRLDGWIGQITVRRFLWHGVRGHFQCPEREEGFQPRAKAVFI